jgi:hypothetical protein
LRGDFDFQRGVVKLGKAPGEAVPETFPKSKAPSRIMIAAAILTILILLLSGRAYVAPEPLRLAFTYVKRGSHCRPLAQSLECVGCGRFVHFARRSPLSPCIVDTLYYNCKGIVMLTKRSTETKKEKRIPYCSYFLVDK